MAFLYVDDVMQLLNVSKSKAYQIIQRLNKELSSKGFIVVAGRVPRKYFNEKFYCDLDLAELEKKGGVEHVQKAV